MERHTKRTSQKKLNEPQLRAIPLRNLRHYFATRTYDRTKEILLVKQLLGHKKLETTMFYTQLITLNEEDEYTVRTATNVKEATDLLENGFTYIQEIDGIKLYRKRKSTTDLPFFYSMPCLTRALAEKKCFNVLFRECCKRSS